MKFLIKEHIISGYGEFNDFTTTGSDYATVGSFDTRLYKTKNFYFTATGHDLSVQILASVDGGVTYPIVTEAAFDVTTTTPVFKSVTTYYSHIRVQAKPKSGGSNGTLSTNFACVSF